MTWEDEDWLQTLDYEHIPFHYHRCHGYGHLLRDSPMNNLNTNSKKEGDQSDQGFTKVLS